MLPGTQSHKNSCVERGGGGGGGGGGEEEPKTQEVGERALYINTPTATTKIHCIITGRTVGHFTVNNVNKAMSIHQNLWEEKRADADSNRSPSASYQPVVLPRWAKSPHVGGGVVADFVSRTKERGIKMKAMT